MGICFFDNTHIKAVQVVANSSICEIFGSESSWENVNYQFWNSRFEVSPTHTLGITWNSGSDKATSRVYDSPLKPDYELWITACRHETSERHYLRFIEVSVRKTV